MIQSMLILNLAVVFAVAVEHLMLSFGVAAEIAVAIKLSFTSVLPP
jgi:hypothetical protein